MGKKKQFIDKKKAVSFRLVHRSQRDPLQADEESSKHVLLPLDGDSTDRDSQINQASGFKKETLEDRQKQQQECGVFYQDDYDYLQHLKPRTDPHLEPLPSHITVIEAKKPEKKKFGKLTLPSEVFASGYEEDEGLLNLAMPVSGPRPDWDPDIVAALDDAIDLNDPDNILEDDFILIANGHIREESDIEDTKPRPADYYPSDEDDFSDQYGGFSDEEDETKSKFSNYSMTSSVIRRTQGLCLLDDRFDKIMEEYDDDEIGALDHEEVSGEKDLNDPLLESIKSQLLDDGQEKGEEFKITRNKVSFDLSEDKKSSDEEEGFVKIAENPKEQWDCESILSTYSNLYNHPTLIKEASKKPGNKSITLSKRDGIPLGILSDGKKTNADETPPSPPDDTQRSRANHARCRGESKEKKRSRKQAVKQERQTRRVEKKTNKLLFKEERKRQEKSVSNSALLVGQKIE